MKVFITGSTGYIEHNLALAAVLGGENISYQPLFETIRNAGKQNLIINPVPVALLNLWKGIIFGLYYLIGWRTHLSLKAIERLVQNRALNFETAVQHLKNRIEPIYQGMENTIRHLPSSYA